MGSYSARKRNDRDPLLNTASLGNRRRKRPNTEGNMSRTPRTWEVQDWQFRLAESRVMVAGAGDTCEQGVSFGEVKTLDLVAMVLQSLDCTDAADLCTLMACKLFPKGPGSAKFWRMSQGAVSSYGAGLCGQGPGLCIREPRTRSGSRAVCQAARPCGQGPGLCIREPGHVVRDLGCVPV